MKSAIVTLAKEVKIVVEGAGASSVAALLSKKFTTKRSKVVCVITGGNIDISLFNELMSESAI